MNTVRNPEKGQQRDNCMLGRDENGRELLGRENPSTISISVFCYEK
jgi:hypothetical protein